MPVISKTVGVTDVTPYTHVWAELADELASPKPFGQPLVTEEEFPRTGLIGVMVFWDRFDHLPDIVRPAIIRKAYEIARPEQAKRIAYMIGYTVPEGEEAGHLPYQIDLAFTDKPLPTDLLERCHAAMKEMGGSTLVNAKNPVLRFSATEQARAALAEIVRRVPESAGMWTIYAEARGIG